MKELVLKRKSIRNYIMAEMDSREIDRLNKFLKSVDQPMDKAQVQFEILREAKFRENYGGLFLVTAPYYLVISGGQTNSHRINAGFLGEMFCLKAAEQDMGSCFLGGARQRDGDKDFIIAVAFGRTEERFRKRADEFKRRPLSEVLSGTESDTAEHEETAELARLYPSAMNRQQQILCARGKQLFVMRKASRLKLIVRMGEIDSGIMLSHILLNPKYKLIEESFALKGYVCDCAVIKK